MKYVFQLINHKNGERSEPAVASWDELAAVMRENNEQIEKDDYILLVAIVDPESENEGLVIPKTPLITIDTFLKMFQNQGSMETNNV